MSYTPTEPPYHSQWWYPYSELDQNSFPYHPDFESGAAASVMPAGQWQVAGPSYLPHDLSVPEAPRHFPAYLAYSSTDQEWPTNMPPYWVENEPPYMTDFQEGQHSDVGNGRINGTNQGHPESPPFRSPLLPPAVPIAPNPPAAPDPPWSSDFPAIPPNFDCRNQTPPDLDNPILLSTIPTIQNLHGWENQGFNSPLLPPAGPSVTAQLSTSGGQTRSGPLAPKHQTIKENSTGWMPDAIRKSSMQGFSRQQYLEHYQKKNVEYRGTKREEFEALNKVLPEHGRTQVKTLDIAIAYIRDLQKTLQEQDREAAELIASLGSR